MAKRELSSTLRSLKFMQRASQREESSKKKQVLECDGNLTSAATVNKKCVVIMEGNQLPGAVKGRMSFSNFNPSIDKLNEEAAKPHHPEATATTSDNQTGKHSLREDGSSVEGAVHSEVDKLNGDHKRKQSQVFSETQYPTKSSKNMQGNHQLSQRNSIGSHKHPKSERLDWNVLRPPKCQNKRG